MKMTWEEVDLIAAKCGAHRVMFDGPLGKTGFSFRRDEIYWIDIGVLDSQELERELLIRK